MRTMQVLLRQKQKLKAVMQTMDKNAPLHQYDGWAYANTLVKLVLIQLEIDKLQKKSRP